MAVVGEYFAKQILARQRAAEKYLEKGEILHKRAYAELDVSLSENIEALNTFPGIPEPVMSLAKSPLGFVLHGRKTDRSVFLLIQNGCSLGYLTELIPNIETIAEDDGDLDYANVEVYELAWSELGIVFRKDSESDDRWAELTVMNMVSRAFSMVINGAITPLFEHE
jgi:hypothetical protein